MGDREISRKETEKQKLMQKIQDSNPDVSQEKLEKIANMRMPFGKYAGRRLIDLPEPYVIWFKNKGFPKGELGELMGLLYEIKVNGLEDLFTALKRR